MSTPANALFKQKVSLKPYNTFGIDVTTDYWIELLHPDDFSRVMDSDLYLQTPHFILGGGSNVLFPDDYHGLIIKNSIPGVNVISEDERFVFIRVGAGVVWDQLVLHCLSQGWGGLENLSMIPGLTGAAPIQNIGAYGVELEEIFVSADTIHLKNGRAETFDREMCRFGYRDSIFKQSGKGQYLITGVTLKLDKQREVNISYDPLKAMLNKQGLKNPTIHDVSRAVRTIRSSKLPDPAVTGNAGSFFKNPIVSLKQYSQLQEACPDIPGYPVFDQPGSKEDTVPSTGTGKTSSDIKIPAAWLIEKCGFKGVRDGDAGIHEHHALILVNHGQATGKQLLGIARDIREAVLEKFAIPLIPEVNIVNGEIDIRS